ncbi:HpcH/HpaI aldolase/citrate lyase family protein [Bordetella sp. 02P26C-1]|uniref:HpcH/HpaI aldolase/citrate lyase family protein n=1 Tax=Bordetella sp. 02P26C-1 TaxID=2683195 RepID=UPI0013551AF7|nr:CoA ester lyase [Bordetella sp. 02P26C-1]MVW78113.1 CoA ester lyase [Bordetella sp. 02P26C-1]
MAIFRTFLFAPANHPRRVEKAFQLGADAVILDLEDACAISEKVASRSKVVEAMQRSRSCLGYVRVNPLSTEFAFGDIYEVVQPGLDGIVLPKTESSHDIKTAEWMISCLEKERGLPVGSIDLMPLIETGRGMAKIGEILSCESRVRRVAFGAGDFCLDMNLQWSRDEEELQAYRSQVVLMSRQAGKEPPIDTVWINIQDTEGFAQSSRRALRMGFQGKLCIYPDQVAVVNDVFSPTEEQVARARKVVAAFEQAEKEGSSSFQLDGQFIDYPILYAAQKLLAVHEKVVSQRAK